MGIMSDLALIIPAQRLRHLRCFLWLWVLVLLTGPSSGGVFDCDLTEPDCGWTWSDGLLLVSMENSTSLGLTAPSADPRNDTKGQFLYYSANVSGQQVTLEVISPRFVAGTKGTCALVFYSHMYNMDYGFFKMVIKANNSTLESPSFSGNSKHSWATHRRLVGAQSQPFIVILEFIVPSTVVPSHIALSDVKIDDCYEEKRTTTCLPRHFKCSEEVCINESGVCDLTEDCVNGEDEAQDCDQRPESAYCTFESDTCGWRVDSWNRVQGRYQTEKYDPAVDHTFKNVSGSYMLTQLSNRPFGAIATMTSPVFEAPPYYHINPNSQFFNSCTVRFFYHKFGRSVGELTLRSVQLEKGSRQEVQDLWRSFGGKGDYWWQEAVPLNNITSRYYLEFVAFKSIGRDNIAIDDISLSPKCFGIGVHPNESIYPPVTTSVNNESGGSFAGLAVDLLKFEFSTCGGKGRSGPNETMCSTAYNNTPTQVEVATERGMEGTQKWTVPTDGLYTVVVRGAGGGSGVNNTEKSFGATIRATFSWSLGDIIYILVGQRGTSACSRANAMCDNQGPRRMKRGIQDLRESNLRRQYGGGGGGGGASVIYQIDDDERIPLVLAAGGGGVSRDVPKNSSEVIDPHGKGVNTSVLPGNGFTGESSGGGGGWNDTTKQSSAGGRSFMEGAEGGAVCRKAASVWNTRGGFGGGGGACASGGGGGGYRGGDAAVVESNLINGQGGISYLAAESLNPLVIPGSHGGDGSVTIIPAQTGCGCEHLCVILNIELKEYYCICPTGLTLSIDGYSCNGYPFQDEEGITARHIVIMVLGILVALAIITSFTLLGLLKYRKSQIRDISQEPLNNPELQLSRLRTAGGMVTEYNPNYEFGGSTCTVQDLREVPREQLTLVKALGQGAFGEVYQGYLTNPNDNSERPVAVKTLPELSAGQAAEMDFLMEALIMSKFKHPNIVSFIGVCFEKLPKFIILELLPGGDLKSFLRECRPKPQKPSPLTVTDLLMLAIDVAKGCQYLEENHFIHRDIAARNCLLTTKEVERVVKIADFGMARDIYRADYYRKGGKAMLPVKWMPPEAFLDGIFTSKTDVWSFGVLLWEVISLGYMPYPGRGNQEVMQLVTSGGRLEPPTNCPSPVYHIMMQCWHPLPDERPNFVTILERLGYCLQDPDVINAPLPVFNRAPSMERDATVMRPSDSDNGGCLRVQRPDPSLLSPGSEDYLIPMPQSTYSMTTERTDLQSSPSMGSVDQLLELEDRGSGVETPSSVPSTWETNFMTPDTPTDGPAVAQWNDLSNPISRSPNMKHCDSANFNNNLKKRPGGYREVPTEDVELANNACGQIPGRKISTSPRNQLTRNDSIKSLEDLPVAPSILNANTAVVDKLKSPCPPVTNNHSSLSLDPSALVRQMGQNMPRRYVNVDVNFNTGDGTGGTTSPLSSRSENSPYDQNTVNRNVGPFDGYAGVNPVA